MGGEGSMMAANESLKTNRNLLAKRKERKGLEGSYAGIEILEFPKMSGKDLETLRLRLQIEKRQLRTKRTLGFIFVVSIIITIVVLL